MVSRKPEPRTLGEWARHDIKCQINRMRKGKEESIEEFAARLYYVQMEIYSTYCGRDLEQDFSHLPSRVQKEWIKLAKKRGRM